MIEFLHQSLSTPTTPAVPTAPKPKKPPPKNPARPPDPKSTPNPIANKPTPFTADIPTSVASNTQQNSLKIASTVASNTQQTSTTVVIDINEPSNETLRRESLELDKAQIQAYNSEIDKLGGKMGSTSNLKSNQRGTVDFTSFVMFEKKKKKSPFASN